MEIELRPMVPADRTFLQQLFSELRRPAFLEVGWNESELESMLQSQFELQASAYASRYPQGEFQIILGDGVPIGRLYVAELPTEIRVIDLALVESARGRGIGTRLLQAVCQRADEKQLVVRFYVEVRNRAQRLYERLGFQAVAEDGPYRLMERPVS